MAARPDSQQREARTLLDRAWSELPAILRTPTQFLGRQYVGCGATIGVMPRCDLACQGCYLDRDANAAAPRPIVDIKQQMIELRAWLGPGGNLQLTDGEVTLRPESELIELISFARAIGLVPMLMTHGETFRRQPGLLERLMVYGGLSEISLHVDTTMRGRPGALRRPIDEADLHGLREEWAERIRTARQRTGRRLAAASTVTVTAANLAGVSGVVRWFLRHADAFKMVSFQPVAAVGRTHKDLTGVTPEALWREIAAGVGGATPAASLRHGTGSLGHPGCTRFVQGLVVDQGDKPEFVPLYQDDDAADRRFLDALLDRLGGTSFRLDDRSTAARRVARLAWQHGPFLLREGLPYLARLRHRGGRLRGARYFNIVSHHFMSAREMATPAGAERLAACAFRVSIDGRLESMCRVNAGGLREAFYRAASLAPERAA